MKFEKISQEDREKLERRLYKTIVEEFRREKIKDGYYKYIVSLQEFKFITDITDNSKMRSVFNKSEYRRLKHRPVKIIQLLMDDIKCCTERITKGYCSKDVDNIDIWFLNIIPDMLQSLMDKKMGVPKEIYDNYENIENGI